MSKSKDKNFGFSNKPRSGKNLTEEEKKLRFVEGILNATNLSMKSRLNLLGSLEGTVADAKLIRMYSSNKAIDTARTAGSAKGKSKHEDLIDFYKKNLSLHSIKSCSEVARQIIKLSGDDRRIAENKFGKERTIAEKIRKHRDSIKII